MEYVIIIYSFLYRNWYINLLVWSECYYSLPLCQLLSNISQFLYLIFLNLTFAFRNIIITKTKNKSEN